MQGEEARPNIYVTLIANEYCPLLDDFLEHINHTGEALKQPPTEEELRKVLGRSAPVEEEHVDVPYSSRAKPHPEEECIGQEFLDENRLVDSVPLSPSEFAGLVLVLCKDQVVIRTLQKLAMGTSTDQYNQDKYRRVFWRLVALRYNDAHVGLTFPFTGGACAADSFSSRNRHTLKAHFQIALGSS